MIVLIFPLALAIQARLLRFPATSLPDPAAGKSFSLPTQSGNALQGFDSTGDFRSEPGRIRRRNEKLPCCFPIGRESPPRRSAPVPDLVPLDRLQGAARARHAGNGKKVFHAARRVGGDPAALCLRPPRPQPWTPAFAGATTAMRYELFMIRSRSSGRSSGEPR